MNYHRWTRASLLLCCLLGIGGRAEAQTGWQLNQNRDSMTGSSSPFISVFALSDEKNTRGILALSCPRLDGVATPTLMIGLGSYMGGDSDGDVAVLIRFDQTPALSSQWWALARGNAIAMRVAGVDDLIERMRRGSVMRIRVTDPLDGERRTWAFSLRGFTNALNQLPCPGAFSTERRQLQLKETSP
jgi:hypothetical protein